MARTAPGPDPPTTATTDDRAGPPLAASPEPPRPKPGAVPWQRNLAAIWVVQILAISGFSLRVPFLPFYLADLGVDTVDGQALWSGLINAGGAGVMALTAPFWGVIADRRGRRMMLIRAAFAGCATVVPNLPPGSCRFSATAVASLGRPPAMAPASWLI